MSKAEEKQADVADDRAHNPEDEENQQPSSTTGGSTPTPQMVAELKLQQAQEMLEKQNIIMQQ